MKYWLLTTEFPPAYGGGIGTYCYENTRMLAENGWEVTVIIPLRHSTKKKETVKNGIRIVEFPISGSRVSHFLGYDTAIAFEFSEIVKEYMQKEGVPDILEAQEYGGIAYYVLQHKHLGYPLFDKLKILITIHAPSFVYYDYNHVPAYRLPYFWIGEMERWCIQAADKLNAPAQFIVNALSKYMPQPFEKKIEIVPYPFRHKQPDLNYEYDPRSNWIFLGKLTPQKGVIPLLNACRILWKEGWSREMNMIGGGDHYYHPENCSIEQWISRNYSAEIRAKKLLLHGNLQPSKWTSLIANGCVVLIPSIGDNYPFTVLESLSRGHLVLTSVQGGQTEIVQHGVNGFLFDHNTPNDLENKIKEIESLSIDKINQIRISAILSVEEKHSYSNVFNKKKKIIESILIENNTNSIFPVLRQIEVPRSGALPNTLIPGLLSIVVPFFNMGSYIEETMNSIHKINYGLKEVIVVNDGSTDNESLNIIKKLQKKFHFKLIHQANMGLAEARNTGARQAIGQYLTFIDADDKVDASYHEKSISVLNKKHNIFFVGCWVQYFEKSTNKWAAFTPEFPYILYYNMTCSGGLVYKTEAFQNCGWNDKNLIYGLEDWDSVIGLLKNGYHGVVIPEPLYHYRIRKNSMARKFTPEKLLFSMRYISEKHASIYSKFAAELSNLYNSNGPGFRNDNPSSDNITYGLPAKWSPLLKQLKKIIRKSSLLKQIAFKLYHLIKRK